MDHKPKDTQAKRLMLVRIAFIIILAVPIVVGIFTSIWLALILILALGILFMVVVLVVHVIGRNEVLEGKTKTCPYCAETIKAAAIKCKHCGADLVTLQYAQQTIGQPAIQTSPQATVQPPVVSTINGTIKYDVVIDGVVAFNAGEQLVVSAISPDPIRPEYCYVVTSNNLQKQFRLSDRELQR